MSRRASKREQYRKALTHIKTAKRELIAAVNVARPADLKFTASLEKVIGTVEGIEQKFEREAGDES